MEHSSKKKPVVVFDGDEPQSSDGEVGALSVPAWQVAKKLQRGAALGNNNSNLKKCLMQTFFNEKDKVRRNTNSEQKISLSFPAEWLCFSDVGWPKN